MEKASNDNVFSKSTIFSKNNIDMPIEQRNTSKGRPSAIVMLGRPLNNMQNNLLEVLPEYNSMVIVKDNKVRMVDLAALTAVTGVEFALFSRGSERLVIRGDETHVRIDVDMAKQLRNKGFTWISHTHPGFDRKCLLASKGDKIILNEFEQETSVIYNSIGQMEMFRTD